MDFEIYYGVTGTTATVYLEGELAEPAVPRLNATFASLSERPPRRVVLRMQELTGLSSSGLRALALAQQMLGPGVQFVLDGPRAAVREAIGHSSIQALLAAELN
jgi:anti-anti-sigma factor